MKRIVSIGEALIDMISNESNTEIKNSQSFRPCVGGAPLNVLGASAKLGVPSSIISMVGEDNFGDKIEDYLDKNNIDKTYLKRTNKANTALAFVSLKSDGAREFSFYRNPSSDMLLDKEDITKDMFDNAYALHFCSVDLIEAPVKYATIKAIKYAKEMGAIISFDPNLRFNLWSDHSKLNKTVKEFINYADILKISDEELEFITGHKDINDAKDYLFSKGVKLIIYTCGANGAYALTPKFTTHVSGIKVNAIDTTGAGDGFIGSFLANLAINNENLEELSYEKTLKYLEFSNKFSAISTTKKGAIDSYLTMEEMRKVYDNI